MASKASRSMTLMISENGNNVVGGVENVVILIAEDDGTVVNKQPCSCTVILKKVYQCIFRNI